MIYSLLAYKDKETVKFNPPMLFPMDKDTAIENITDGVIKGKIEGAENFELYVLGTYDTITGTFKCGEPEKVCDLAVYVRNKDTSKN